MMSSDDPYAFLNPVLDPWAHRHGLHLVKLYRDGWVRSIWKFDSKGQERVQIWLEAHKTGQVTAIACECLPSPPGGWGRREERVATLDNLENALDELRVLAFEWSGPGSFG